MTTIPPEGAELTQVDQFIALPIGSVIQYDGTDTYHKISEDGWTLEDSGREYPDYTSSYFALDGRMKVARVGPPPGTPEPLPETLKRFQWRYRTATLHGASTNSIDTDTVHEALQELGVHDEDFPIGPGVQIRYEGDKNGAPEGTIIMCGEPNNWGRFGLWRRNHGNWERLIGGRDWGRNRPMTVVQVGNDDTPVPWMTEMPAEGEDMRILEFKAKAYKVGKRYKDEHGWCGTYDAVVEAAGVSDRAVIAWEHRPVGWEGRMPGEKVSRLEAAALPTGTLLRHIDGDTITYWMRTATATNRARTRRVFGVNDGDVITHSASVMEIAQFPREGDWPYFLADLTITQPIWNALPPGTVFEHQNSNYMIHRNERASVCHRSDDPVHERGNHYLDAFNPSRYALVIRHLPTPERETNE